jgi:hypothetical protein
MFGEGLNFRLGTKGLSVIDAILNAAEKGITTGNLFAMPEQYGWEYSDGKKFVCSCFVTTLFKASGILGIWKYFQMNLGRRMCINWISMIGGIRIEGQRHVKWQNQILNFARLWVNIELNYFTIQPYSHMNESCPSIAPEFKRPNNY